MVTIKFEFIGNEPWHVAYMGVVPVLRDRTRTGLILTCWTCGLVVEG